MTAAEIRQHFLDFFKSKGHSIVPSAPIVVKNDPTLLFTNAGMNQFKDMFLGNKKPIDKRVADTQKCLRVSGKHNDLEEVGVDTYHHTMFEMLGNWSFGDYFKKDAIEWSWELLTKVYKIPADRLYVTIFEGDSKENLERDTEAYQCWLNAGVPAERILNGNKKDNFWEMGDTGPCGPCSEIHFDGRPDEERAQVPGASLVNADNAQVIEIWNNVFMEFNRKADGSLEKLPAQHVDTGMGFERLVRVMQGKTSNYDTDLFLPTIQSTEQLVGQQYKADDTKESIAFRVVADHLRAISFTIADGQLPSSTGAGYVIRRILRRAVRYYHTFLGYKQPLLHQLVPVLANQFKNVFPELAQQQAFVANVVKEEEISFLRTMESGLKRIEALIKADTNKSIAGKDAFELYDTYGFPFDLTRLIASENGFVVDEAAFNEEMAAQKSRSRKAASTETGDWQVMQEVDQVRFIGYNELQSSAKLVKYRQVKQKDKTLYQVVLDHTPFYAESGGQVGDTGLLSFGGEMMKVLDTKKENDLIIHFLEELPEQIGAEVTAMVDADRRRDTTAHHSVTHLIHAALRRVLGTHVQQKGSLVTPHYMRFDFAHFSKVTDAELREVEQIVNAKIRENVAVEIASMSKDDAIKKGAMALFGEKYGDVVRVVTMDEQYSVELCGGTHVASTGNIGYCRIIAESAVAAGVRRIEVVTGAYAENYVETQLLQLDAVSALLKGAKHPAQALQNLLDENAAIKKEMEKAILEKAQSIKQGLKGQFKQINGINVLCTLLDLDHADAIKQIAYDLRQEMAPMYLAIGAVVGGKANLSVMMSDDVVAQKAWKAKDMIKSVSGLIKGGGGGQDFYATAGGSNPDGLQEALAQLEKTVSA
jgi:alanyl-tRNA synthetase